MSDTVAARGIVPPPLAAGARVRIVAPSGPVAREPFLAGVALLHARGLQPCYSATIFRASSYLAGSDAERLAELQEALDDTHAMAIWAARGGYGAARVMGLVQHRPAVLPRWLVGFSDITAVHGLWGRAGVCSLHAANISTLASWQPTMQQQLWDMLQAAPGRQVYQGAGWAPGGGVPVRGRIWGGNLTVLASLCGTGLLPRLDDGILFIEDVGEAPYRLDRSLTQLRLGGMLDGVRGVAVGQLTRCGGSQTEQGTEAAQQALLSVLAPLAVPVVGGLPLGHEADSAPLLLGGLATLDAATGSLVVDAV